MVQIKNLFLLLLIAFFSMQISCMMGPSMATQSDLSSSPSDLSPETGDPGYSNPDGSSPGSEAPGPGAPIAEEPTGQILYSSMGYDSAPFNNSVGTMSPTLLMSNISIDKDYYYYSPPNYQISPDRQFQFSIQDTRAIGRFDIARVNLATGTHQIFPLNFNQSNGVYLTLIKISNDNNLVLFSMSVYDYVTSTSTLYLYSIRLSDSRVSCLSCTHNTFSTYDTQSLVFKSDFSSIFILADLEVKNQKNLYNVKLDGTGFTKLNGTISGAGTIGAGINSFLLSPDENFIIYKGNLTAATPTKLYRVNVDGTCHAQVSPLTGVATQGVGANILISPDSGKIAFAYDRDIAGAKEIFAADASGSGLVKLNSGIISNGTVDVMAFSFDSTNVAYLGDQETNDVRELYVAQVSGAGTIKLNEVLTVSGDAEWVGLSPDGSRILFLTDQTVDGKWDFFAIDWVGGNRVLLKGQTSTYSNPISVTPVFINNTDLLYRTDLNADSIYEIRRVSLDGTGETPIFTSSASYSLSQYHNLQTMGKLNQAKTHYYIGIGGTGQVYRAYKIAIDGSGSTIVFDSNSIEEGVVSIEVGCGTDNTYVRKGNQAFLVSPDGSTKTEVFFDTVASNLGVRMTPNGQHLGVRRNKVANEFSDKQIFTFNLSTQAIAQVTNWVTSILVRDWILSPDSQLVQIVSLSPSLGQGDVYRANIDGSALTKINPSSIDYDGQLASGANNRLVFQTYFSDDEIYSLSSDGTSFTRVHPTLYDEAGQFQISPNGQKVVYEASQDSNQTELYMSNIDGTSNFKINSALPPGAYPSMDENRFSPNNQLYAFLSPTLHLGTSELFTIGTNGTGRKKMHSTLPAGRSVMGLGFTPDSNWIVYFGKVDSTTVVDIFAVRTDGSSSFKIGGSMTNGNWVSSQPYAQRNFQFKSDSSAVAFAARKENANQVELYMSTLDGRSIHKLNPPMTNSNGTVENDFKITSNDSHLIYRADTEVIGQFQLYSVDLTTRKVRKVSLTPSGANDFVVSFSVASNTIVYRMFVNGNAELYSVNLDGTNHKRLHTDLSGVANISSSYLVSPVTKRVVFHGNLENPAKSSVYSAPID